MSSNDQYPTTTSRSKAILSILEEREAQDKQWGGPTHDDEHFPADWFHFINRQLGKLALPVKDVTSFRRGLVKIGALAVAAIERCDRALEHSPDFPSGKIQNQIESYEAERRAATGESD